MLTSAQTDQSQFSFPAGFWPETEHVLSSAGFWHQKSMTDWPVSGSSWLSGNFKKSGKVRESQWKIRESRKARKNQSAWWKSWQRFSKNCELFNADYFYLYFWICFTSLVSSVIASDLKPTLVFCVNKLVMESNLFCLGKSGKSRGKWIL